MNLFEEVQSFDIFSPPDNLEIFDGQIMEQKTTNIEEIPAPQPRVNLNNLDDPRRSKLIDKIRKKIEQK